MVISETVGQRAFLIGPLRRIMLEERKPANRVGDDYVPHFDFSHLPYADYQAIIDVLQSRNAL